MIQFSSRKQWRLGIIFWLVLAASSISRAQDPRFSQFYAIPLQTNPALNGVFEGRVRVGVNYRVLYPALLSDRPFRTYAAGAESRFRVIKRDYVALGVSVRQDEAGIGAFNRTQALLGGSFLKQLSDGRGAKKVQYLVAGIQGGFEQHSLEADRLWFSSQYDRGTNSVNTSLDSGEPNSGTYSNLAPDLNAGVLWYLVSDEQTSVYAGIAGHHILEPEIGFIGEPGTRMYRKLSAHAGGEFPLSKQVTLLPAALVSKQGPSTSITTGASFRYSNRYWKEIALRTGLWTHIAGQNGVENSGLGLDALTITAIFEMERWNLGFGYDITSSSLRTSNYNRGAFEISLVYLQPGKERFKVRCPKY